MADVKGKVVMITGGSAGLGLALAVGFARAGARVSICGRNDAALEAACARITGEGGECVASVVDVSDEQMVAQWVEGTVDRLGAPAALINNASILGPRVELAGYPIEEWRAVIDVNLTGAFLVTHSVLPHMLSAGAGSIVNVSSGAARPPRTRWGAYAISKLALDGFTVNLAEELRGSGIRVNAVDPGPMRTTMRATAYPEEDPETLPLPAANLPLFLWLASDDSANVTGERFVAAEWLKEQGSSARE